MSRIGKSPINVPKGVEVKVDNSSDLLSVSVKGPKGLLERTVHPSMKVEIKDGQVLVIPKEDKKEFRSFHGLTRSLINNMVVGVSEGFKKELKLIGVGYRAAMKGKGVTLTLGYSHPIDFDPPEGIELSVDKQTTVFVSGPEKELVGRVSAKIRSFRPPEPYHGKGVRYADERIITKVGKTGSKK